MKTTSARLLLVLATTPVVALAASTNVFSAKVETVTVLLGPSISGIEMVKDIVAQFEKSNPDINIKLEIAPPASPAEVLLPRAAGGALPDLYFDMPLSPLLSFQKNNLLYPWDKFPDYWKVMRDRGTEEFAKDIQITGHSYLLPWQVETNLMVWNTDLLGTVGIGRIPSAYSDFLQAGQKLKARDIGLMSLNSPGYWDSRIGDFYNTYLAASGGKTLIKDGKANINNSTAKQVLQLFLDMKKMEYIPKPTPEDAWSTQKLVMKYTGSGDKEYLGKAKFSWTASQWIVPDDYSGPKPPYVYANMKGLTLFQDSKVKDEAWKFVKFFINSKSDMITLNYGRMPVRDMLAEDPDFDAFWQRYPKYRVFATQMKRMKGLDMVPKVEDIMSVLDQEFTSVVDQKKTIKEALASLEKKMNQLLGKK